MQIINKKLPKGQVELTIEIGIDKLDKYLKEAAQKISAKAKIDGFRPGKASYDIIKQRFGEMSIYQEALDFIIRDTLFKALVQENIESIGQPQIDVDKLAPNNPVVYRATITLLPEVKIKEYKNIKVEPKDIKIDETRLKKSFEQLQKMRAKEIVADKVIGVGDKAVVDFDIYLDNVPIDGGQHKDYPIYIGENFFVPGFEDNVVGLKKGEEKEFKIKFPKDYFHKMIAGKNADIKIKIKEVYSVEKPELNDEFAKTVGFDGIDKIKDHIKNSLEQEDKAKDDQRIELEIFDGIINQSEFSEFPQTLIDSELDKMFSELRYNIESQGITFEDYLINIKTTVEDMRKNFLPQADKRLKTALITRNIAILEKIVVSEAEIEKEVQQALQNISDDGYKKNIQSPSYKSYLENFLISRKVIDKLREWNVKN